MAQKKHRPIMRRVVVVVVILTVMGLLGLALAPSMAGTRLGRSLVVSWVNRAIPGSLSVTSWSLRWGGPQQVTGLAIVSPEGQEILKVDKIRAADLSLWRLLRGSMDLGVIQLEGIDGRIEQYSDGSTNLDRALIAERTTSGGGSREPSGRACDTAPSVRIEWLDVNLTWTAPGMLPVAMSDLVGHIDLTDLAAIDLALIGSVGQSGAGVNLFQCRVLADYREDRMVIQPRSGLSLTVTPAAFASLRPPGQSSPWTLGKPAALTVQLDRAATVGLRADGSIDYRNTSLTLTAACDDLILARDSDGYALRDLKAQIDMPDPAEAIVITVTADMTRVGHPATSRLTSQTRLSQLLDADGQPDLVHATITTDTRGTGFPTAMLDGLTGSGGELAQMFGPVIDVQARGDYPGNLDLSLTGTLGHVQVPIHVDAARVLTLQRDGVIRLTVTAQLADTVLSHINPFLAETVRGRDPIRIDLKRQGTRIPLTDFSLNACSADALVTLGTLELGEGGFIGQLRNLLGRKKQAVYRARFSPTLVQLRKGYVSYTDMRMDIVDEKMLLVFAGRLHVDPESARDVVMTATIPGDVIGASVKALRGSLGPEEGLTIPIGGTIDHPKPDMGRLRQSLRDMVLKAGLRRGLGKALGDDAAGEAVGAVLQGLFGGKKK